MICDNEFTMPMMLPSAAWKNLEQEDNDNRSRFKREDVSGVTFQDYKTKVLWY